MIKWKFFLIIALSVALAIGISFGADFIHLINEKDNDILLKQEVIDDFCADNRYLGNCCTKDVGGTTTYEFDIKKVLKLKDNDKVSVKNDCENVAEISVKDNQYLIYIKLFDKQLTLTVSNGEKNIDYAFITVEGVNVLSAEDIYKLGIESVKDKNKKGIFQTMVLQDDIYLDNLNTKFNDYSLYNSYNSLYGNGFTIYCDNYQNIDARNKKSEWATFTFCGEDLCIRDTHFVGKRYEKNQIIDLNALKDSGIPVFIKKEKGLGNPKQVKASIENCIFENFAQGLKIKGAEVNIKGCLLQNFAVCGISLYTYPENKYGPSNLTLENSVIANAVTAGICSWCPKSGISNSNKSKITMKGFVDFYCWQQVDNVKIVPETEPYAKIANGLFKEVFGGKGEKKYCYNYKGETYINIGIIVISVLKDTKNNTEVSEYEEQNLEKTNVLKIIGDVAEGRLFSTLDLYGYAKNPPILPDNSISDNNFLYDEMKNGRKR